MNRAPRGLQAPLSAQPGASAPGDDCANLVWIDLEPKVFDVLVDHRDRIVSKDELLNKLWPGRVVGETALPRCMMAARKAVGDDGATQQVIKTHYGRGDRFMAPLATVQPAPSVEFRVLSQEEEVSSQEEERRRVIDQPLAPGPQPFDGLVSSASSTTTVAPRRCRTISSRSSALRRAFFGSLRLC